MVDEKSACCRRLGRWIEGSAKWLEKSGDFAIQVADFAHYSADIFCLIRKQVGYCLLSFPVLDLELLAIALVDIAHPRAYQLVTQLAVHG